MLANETNNYSSILYSQIGTLSFDMIISCAIKDPIATIFLSMALSHRQLQKQAYLMEDKKNFFIDTIAIDRVLGLDGKLRRRAIRKLQEMNLLTVHKHPGKNEQLNTYELDEEKINELCREVAKTYRETSEEFTGLLRSLYWNKNCK